MEFVRVQSVGLNDSRHAQHVHDREAQKGIGDDDAVGRTTGSQPILLRRRGLAIHAMVIATFLSWASAAPPTNFSASASAISTHRSARASGDPPERETSDKAGVPGDAHTVGHHCDVYQDLKRQMRHVGVATGLDRRRVGQLVVSCGESSSDPSLRSADLIDTIAQIPQVLRIIEIEMD